MEEWPWPRPQRYEEARQVHPALTVVVNVGDEWVEGDLLLWLRSDRHGWYGYVHWSRNRWIYTQPVPADRLRVVRPRSVNVYDDGDWRPGTLHGWRRYQDREWEAAVVVRGMNDTPRWLPASRVRPGVRTGLEECARWRQHVRPPTSAPPAGMSTQTGWAAPSLGSEDAGARGAGADAGDAG